MSELSERPISLRFRRTGAGHLLAFRIWRFQIDTKFGSPEWLPHRPRFQWRSRRTAKGFRWELIIRPFMWGAFIQWQQPGPPSKRYHHICPKCKYVGGPKEFRVPVEEESDERTNA